MLCPNSFFRLKRWNQHTNSTKYQQNKNTANPGAEVARFKYLQSLIRYADKATKHRPIVQKFHTIIPASALLFGSAYSVFKMKTPAIVPPKKEEIAINEDSFQEEWGKNFLR